MQITRRFTREVQDPFAGLNFAPRSSSIRNPNGSLGFRSNDLLVQGNRQVPRSPDTIHRVLRKPRFHTTRRLKCRILLSASSWLLLCLLSGCSATVRNSASKRLGSSCTQKTTPRATRTTLLQCPRPMQRSRSNPRVELLMLLTMAILYRLEVYLRLQGPHRSLSDCAGSSGLTFARALGLHCASSGSFDEDHRRLQASVCSDPGSRVVSHRAPP